MKKILLIFLLLITGCTTEIKIQGEIKEIKFNELIIQKEEYPKIKELINIEYKDDKKIENLENKLIIKTDEEIYYYSLSEKYIVNENRYAENKKLYSLLKKIENKYYNKDIYTIDYMKSYESSENNTNITLDKTSNYIIIKLKEEVKNFRINELDEEKNDIDLLYSEEKLGPGMIVIKKTINYNYPDIRINFSNQYNYNISIIPNYDNEEEEYEFLTSYKMKNSKL